MRTVLPATRAADPVSGLTTVIKRLLSVTLIVLLAGLTAALATVIAPPLLGYETLVVSGGSMGDSIPNGSLVIARWLDREDVAAGDVILIKEEAAGSEARPKLHRVVSIEHEANQALVRTRGDGNKADDPLPYVLPDAMLTPAYEIPYLGFLVTVISWPLGRLLIVTLPVTIFCLLKLRSIWFSEPEASLASAP